MSPNTIEGEIVFAEATSSFSKATLYVRLEDVSLADAPSRVVAQEVVPNVSLEMSNPRPVPFSIQVPGLDRRTTYNLAVHVDVDNDGSVTSGDYITMESVPVPTSPLPARVNIRVRRVL